MGNVVYLHYEDNNPTDSIDLSEETRYVLNGIAEAPEGLRLRPKNFTRKQIAEAFVNAFEMIGGVPRLAVWADKNQDKFYPILAKLLPSASSDEVAEGEKIFRMAVPPKAIDGPIDVTPTRIKEQDE